MTDHLTLAEIAEIAAALDADGQTVPVPAATSVQADPVRGHILVTGTPEHEAPTGRDVAFVDVGPYLDLWSYQGASLSPAIARELGLALVAWADKKNPPPFDLMVTLEGDALYDLRDAINEEHGPLAADTHLLRLAVDSGTFKIKANEGPWSPPLTDGVLIQKGHEIP